MRRERLRFGLIGLGRWGHAFARTLSQMDDVLLARIATSNPGRLSGLGHEVAITPDWRDVIAATDLQGVILAVPPLVQPAIMHAAIDAGLPILAEKPLALSLGEAEALRAHVAARRGFVLVDHTQLFSPSYEALRTIVHSTGGIERIRTSAGDWGPFRPDVPVLWDWGPHDVAMCLDLVRASPVQARAVVLEYRETPGGLGQTIELDLAFAGELTARCVVSNIASARGRTVSVDLSTETLLFEDSEGHRLLRAGRAGGRPVVVPTSPEAPLRRVVASFAAGVRDGGDMSSLDLGVDVVRTLAQADAYVGLSAYPRASAIEQPDQAKGAT